MQNTDPVPGADRPAPGGHRTFIVAMVMVAMVLIGAAIGRSLAPVEPAGVEATADPSAALPAASGAPTGPSPYAVADVGPAPDLELIDQDERAFDLTSLRGTPALVFFGYTHCPDVCPATIGDLNEVLAQRPGGAGIVFVTVDPERDTPEFLREYLKYMPAGYVALTGSAAQVRAAADAWGIRYEREETGSASGYAMAHSVKVFLIDADGDLRARYPWGVEPQAMIDDLDRLSIEANT